MSPPTPPTLVPSKPRPTEPYPEHDKLGPLAVAAPGATSYGDGTQIRAHVLAAVREAVEPARAARARAATDPSTAVHEVRKAIRRTRALVDLIGDALPRSERRDIIRALRDARRTLGQSRDLTVASTALIDLTKDTTLAPVATAIVKSAQAEAPAVDAVADDVIRAVEVALTQADAIAAALPDEVSARTLVRGLSNTYADARRSRRKARHSERAVHRWRRRSKELSYQLSILADIPAAAALRQQLSGLDDQLSGVVDRLLLKDYVGLYGHAGDPLAAAMLLTQVHDELIEQRDQARKGSKELFAVGPRKLRRRLRRALAASTVAQPVDDSAG